MRNYIAPGQSIDVTVTEAAFGAGGAVAGYGYVVGSIFGVAANTAAVGETVTLHLTGIYEFDLLFAPAVVGQSAYWTAGYQNISNEASVDGGQYKIGSIVGVPNGKVQVRLDGVAVAPTPATSGG